MGEAARPGEAGKAALKVNDAACPVKPRRRAKCGAGALAREKVALRNAGFFCRFFMSWWSSALALRLDLLRMKRL